MSGHVVPMEVIDEGVWEGGSKKGVRVFFNFIIRAALLFFKALMPFGIVFSFVFL